mmetsp:Transcript_21420/g.57116  ORF Transcript_21420/g.57116 Transcript_21420/m.57116 type:complete len:248 (-) Transcript_21420:364-1107(-)
MRKKTCMRVTAGPQVLSNSLTLQRQFTWTIAHCTCMCQGFQMAPRLWSKKLSSVASSQRWSVSQRSGVLHGASTGSSCTPRMESAIFSASMMVGALRFPLVMEGITDASMTRSPSRPSTRPSAPTTLPIAHVHDKWYPEWLICRIHASTAASSARSRLSGDSGASLKGSRAFCSSSSTVSRSARRWSFTSCGVARKLGSMRGARTRGSELSRTLPRLVGRNVPQCAWNPWNGKNSDCPTTQPGMKWN